MLPNNAEEKAKAPAPTAAENSIVKTSEKMKNFLVTYLLLGFFFFSGFLDPFGKFIGLDGVIIMAFLLGFPANEIVIPIMIMGYMSLGMITDMGDLNLLKNLFVNNGWTYVTAICVMLFSIFHFPCLTTIFTIKKETGKWKWAFISFIVPLIVGIVLCFFVKTLFGV